MNEYGLRALWLNEYKKNEMLCNRDDTTHQRKTAPAAASAAEKLDYIKLLLFYLCSLLPHLMVNCDGARKPILFMETEDGDRDR